MNFLRVRPIAHVVRARTYATTSPPFVPPSSLDNIQPAPPSDTDAARRKPPSPTFYTARADFYDGLRLLEDALAASQRALRAAHLFPFPDAARTHLPPAHTAWKTKAEIAHAFGSALTTARHRRVQGVLAQLNDLRRIAAAGAEDGVAREIGGVLRVFERADKDALLRARGRRKPVAFDEHGRTYTLGKRKESAARVWIVPVQTPPAPEPGAAPAGDLYSLLHPRSTLQPTTVLVNNLPLAQYFPNGIDRQRVVRPFKLAGLLGAFNVFALVRGGGTTGQAGALAHGIAKGLVAHVPDVELILRRAKLLKRDPRMVERKKTGFAKARKRYTWVKR